MTLLAVFVIITLLFLFLKKEDSIVYIPLFTLIVDVLAIFISDYQLDQTNFANTLLSYFRILVFIFVSIMVSYKYHIRGRNVVIILFMIYLIVKSSVAIDPYTSFKSTSALISFLWLFLAAFYYFRVNPQLQRYFQVIRFTLLIYLLNALFFTIFKIGNYFYTSDLLYQGSVPLFAAYGIMYSIFLFITFKDKIKRIDIFLILSNFAILVLISKRTSIILLILGFFIIILMDRRGFLSRQFIYITLILLVFGGIVFYYTFSEAQINRSRVNELRISEEGRYLEYVILYNEIILSDDLQTVLFGKELFLDLDRFGLQQNILDVKNRRIHSDYAILLYGAGLIGLILYYLIFIQIYRQYYFIVTHPGKYMNLRAVFIAIIVCLLINGFVDSLTVPTARAIPFLYMGSLLGTLMNYSSKGQNETSTS